MAGMEVMREFVSLQYGGKWRERVRKMPDNQVRSIYNRMVYELDELKKMPVAPRTRVTGIQDGVQLSFFENSRTLKVKEDYIR